MNARTTAITTVTRWRAIAAVTAIAAAGTMAAASGQARAIGDHPAGGPDPTIPVLLEYFVTDPFGDPYTVADGLTPQLFTSAGADSSNLCTTATTTAAETFVSMYCSVPPGDYIVGVDGIPDGYYVDEVDCDVSLEDDEDEQIDSPAAEFTVDSDSAAAECEVFIVADARLWLDKVVDGGDATASRLHPRGVRRRGRTRDHARRPVRRHLCR